MYLDLTPRHKGGQIERDRARTGYDPVREAHRVVAGQGGRVQSARGGVCTWTFHRESGEGSVTSANDEGGSPYIHTHIHTYIHTYIHTHTHTHNHACMHTSTHPHIHTHSLSLSHTKTNTYTHTEGYGYLDLPPRERGRQRDQRERRRGLPVPRVFVSTRLQGYLAHKKPPPPKTLQ